VRTKALSQAQAESVLQSFERSLVPSLLVLELEPQDFRNANARLRGWSTSLRAADAMTWPSPAAVGPASADWML
jgi:hypothetical protein